MSLPAAVAFSLSTAAPPPIEGGAPTDAFPATVALGAVSGDEGRVFCTGTVVAEGWVLTAAHCIEDGEAYQSSGWSLQAFAATDVVAGEISDRAGWVESHLPGDWPSAGYEADIALIELSKALGEPAVRNEEPVGPGWVGRELTLVGFGWTAYEAGDAGVKRALLAEIETVDEVLLETWSPDGNACRADSGGSAWLPDGAGGHVLVAVPVYIDPEGQCLGGRTGAVRVDAWARWIDRTLAGLPTDTGEDVEPEDTGPVGGGGGGGEEPGGCGCASAARPVGPLRWLGLVLLLGARRSRS